MIHKPLYHGCIDAHGAVPSPDGRLLATSGRGSSNIYLIDAVEVGAGRIYRTDQPDWYLMNTVAGQISSFSGLPDDLPARSGSGPSLVEWWESVEPGAPDPDGYAPRARHGLYMNFVVDAIERGLPAHVRFSRVSKHVLDISQTSAGHLLSFSDGQQMQADRVVLVTGHSLQEPSGDQRALADFALPARGLRG